MKPRATKYWTATVVIFWFPIIAVIIHMFVEKRNCFLLVVESQVSKDADSRAAQTNKTHMHEGNVMSQLAWQMNPVGTKLQSLLSDEEISGPARQHMLLFWSNVISMQVFWKLDYLKG